MLNSNCYSLAVDVDASRTDCCERAQDSWTLRWIRGKNDINTVQFLAQSDRFVSLDLNVSSRATVFNLVLSVYVLFSLKAVSTIDWHYMTDRLQQFELKIFFCVLLKQQSPLHLGCPEGKQINIKYFNFWVNYPFNADDVNFAFSQTKLIRESF